jgi:ABC-type sugar transport system substrate-binding protein
MRFSSGFRAALVALFALAGAGVPPAAHADGGTIWISELKGGWIIAASGGSVGSAE